MKLWQTLLMGSAIGLWPFQDAWAITEDFQERFVNIPVRNVFGLKPPPPPAEAPPPKEPSVNVKLTGIISFTSPIKAILQVQPQGKPVESLVLAENQAEGSVEVKEIDVDAGTVKIVSSGQEVVLDFVKDGIKPPTGAAPANPALPGGVPTATANARLGVGRPGMPGSTTALGGFNPNASGTSGTTASSISSYLNARNLNVGRTGVGGVPLLNNAGAGSPIPGQAFRFDANGSLPVNQPKWPPEQQMSQEESIIHIELARERYKNSEIPMPPLPPTVITPPQPGEGGDTSP